MTVSAHKEGCVPRQKRPAGFVVPRSTDGESDLIWSNAERPPSFQPSEVLGALPRPRSRPAAEIDPESLTFDDLEVNVSTAHLQMVEDHVRTQVTADNCKRLLQRAYLSLVRVRALDDEFK